MARPKSDDPVENRSVGLPKSLWAAIDAAVEDSGGSRSLWFAEAAKQSLGVSVITKPAGKTVSVITKRPAAKKQAATNKNGHMTGCTCIMCAG